MTEVIDDHVVIFDPSGCVAADAIEHLDDRAHLDIQTRLFADFADQRGVELLADFDHAARKAPRTFQRLVPALDEQYAVAVEHDRADAEDRAIWIPSQRLTRLGPTYGVTTLLSRTGQDSCISPGMGTWSVIALRHAAIGTASTILIALSSSCVRPIPRAIVENAANVDTRRLWVEPDIATRDLFHGPGGPQLAPSLEHEYEFLKADRSGYSSGYQVRGPDGTKWSVKLGDEAQTEIAASRILWAIGYHQPPTYYLPRWIITGKENGSRGAARFRPELSAWNPISEWSWYENEFVDTRPFKGLLVANLVLNSWDWKTTNNKVYEVIQAQPDSPARLYIVRDLGASLGKTTFPALLKWTGLRGFGQGTRNDLEGFESQGFVKRARGERIEFDYSGIHQRLVDTITIADVVWTCRLMAQLSDQQWNDAFRAAGYAEEWRERYVAKLKAKIAEGIALASS